MCYTGSLWTDCVCVCGRCVRLQIFFAVYEMAIDTVLLSFCEDCERNSGHPRCAPPLLLEAIGESKVAASAVAVGHPVPKGQRS